jgi:hypothetical protein
MGIQVTHGAGTESRLPLDIEARNREICARYAAGETLAAIGCFFQISGERVRKILKRFGLDKTNAGLAIRNARKASKCPHEPYCLRVYRCTPEELKKFTRAERQAFLQQKKNVRRAAIEWDLTLPEWSEIWFRSGKWLQRGRGGFKYGLCRLDSSKSFSAANILILKNSKSEKCKLRTFMQFLSLEFRRQAWILSNLEVAWSEMGRNESARELDSMRESIQHDKYFESVKSGERERLDGVAIGED